MREPIEVLQVEDEPGHAALVRIALEEELGEGVRLTTVDRLAHAMRRIASDPPDVVLLDLCLPDSTGLSGIVHLRTRAPHVPIVVHTSHDDEELAGHALASGASAFLTKGLTSPAALARALRKAGAESIRVAEPSGLARARRA